MKIVFTYGMNESQGLSGACGPQFEYGYTKEQKVNFPVNVNLEITFQNLIHSSIT